jgi:hypothetical protein
MQTTTRLYMLTAIDRSPTLTLSSRPVCEVSAAAFKMTAVSAYAGGRSSEGYDGR